MRTYNQVICEIDSWAQHPDIANNPSMQAKAKAQQDKREQARLKPTQPQHREPQKAPNQAPPQSREPQKAPNQKPQTSTAMTKYNPASKGSDMVKAKQQKQQPQQKQPVKADKQPKQPVKAPPAQAQKQPVKAPPAQVQKQPKKAPNQKPQKSTATPQKEKKGFGAGFSSQFDRRASQLSPQSLGKKTANAVYDAPGNVVKGVGKAGKAIGNQFDREKGGGALGTAKYEGGEQVKYAQGGTAR